MENFQGIVGKYTAKLAYELYRIKSIVVIFDNRANSKLQKTKNNTVFSFFGREKIEHSQKIPVIVFDGKKYPNDHSKWEKLKKADFGAAEGYRTFDEWLIFTTWDSIVRVVTNAGIEKTNKYFTGALNLNRKIAAEPLLDKFYGEIAELSWLNKAKQVQVHK
ncbi:MAG: hypothetical protein NTY48_03690 [Candidatus Diapherotrites archaeon]|nr:hypothetical protein [Candidatus Diapherotrites archaeon]